MPLVLQVTIRVLKGVYQDVSQRAT